MINYSIEAQSCELEILMTKGINWPEWKINHHCQTQQIKCSEFEQTVLISLPNITDCNSIVFHRSGKQDNDTIVDQGQIVRDQCIQIKKIWINDVLLENHVIAKHSEFRPVYSESNLAYAREHNTELAEIKHELDFFYNGTWTFNFSTPFFYWYNQKLMDEMQNFNQWAKQTYLGIADDEKLQQLKDLFEKLS